MRDFRTLIVWQMAHQMVLAVYEVIKGLPREERFAIADQLRRAAVSVPTNIAEGCGQLSRNQFARFLQISIASASETEYLLLLCRDLNYLPDDQYAKLHQQLTQIRKMLTKLVKKLQEGEK
ncbi:MAG: four helix bundle protein [Anaerolineales bacterium]|nr:four helix bundle protein [Anaerolineales bacterium]